MKGNANEQGSPRRFKMEKLRIAIIGTGGISNSHTHGYKTIPEKCEIVAVCDLDEKKAKNYAESYGVPAYYTDFNEMFAKEKIDAVSVCTWNSSHKPATIAALNAGCHVLCEKPMAMNTAEAEEMLECAKKNGKILMVGFVRRFGNDADLIRKFRDGGTLGDLYYAKASYLRRNGCPGGWFGDKEYSGGGPLIDLGVHVIDLVRFLAGNPKPVSAYGVTYNNLDPNRAGGGQSWVSTTTGYQFKYNVEDMAAAMVRFDNGLTLSVEASFKLNLKNDRGEIELFGTKAGAKISPQVEYFGDMNGTFVDIKPFGDTALNFDGLFAREIQHFVDCCLGNCECISPAEDGVVLMKILDAIYESAKTGHEVIIK